MGKILNYKVRLEVMGPVHIGSGVTLEKSEYIYNKNMIYVLDPVKMFDYMRKTNLLGEYEKEIMSGAGSNMTFFVRNKEIPVSEYKNWASYSYRIDEEVNVKNMQINTCIKDAYNMPYIPGSSLKGCIRNAVLNTTLIEKEKSRLADDIEWRSEIYAKRNVYLKNESEKADDVFRRYNLQEGKRPAIENDIFKGLRISDSRPLKRDDITLCPKIDVSPEGRRGRINILRECIRPGTIAEFNLEINTGIFEYDADALLDCIRTFYKNQRECFLRKFQPLGNDNKRGDFLYIGGGTGFVSKTALYGLFHNRERGLKVASVILDKVDSVNKGKKTGDHIEDPKKYGVSPHMRKCTLYNNVLTDFGLCKIDFQPIG